MLLHLVEQAQQLARDIAVAQVAPDQDDEQAPTNHGQAGIVRVMCEVRTFVLLEEGQAMLELHPLAPMVLPRARAVKQEVQGRLVLLREFARQCIQHAGHIFEDDHLRLDRVRLQRFNENEHRPRCLVLERVVPVHIPGHVEHGERGAREPHDDHVDLLHKPRASRSGAARARRTCCALQETSHVLVKVRRGHVAANEVLAVLVPIHGVHVLHVLGAEESPHAYHWCIRPGAQRSKLERG